MVMNQICMHWSSQYRTPAQLIFKPSLADPSCSSNDTHMHRQKYTHHGFFSSPSEHSVPTFFFFSSSWLAESKMRPDFCILGCFLALADCWMSWSWASSSSSLSMGSWYGIQQQQKFLPLIEPAITHGTGEIFNSKNNNNHPHNSERVSRPAADIKNEERMGGVEVKAFSIWFMVAYTDVVVEWNKIRVCKKWPEIGGLGRYRSRQWLNKPISIY